MARKVFGKITNQAGAGVAGLRVQAWDDDWPDGDDLMGEAITNAAGDYVIEYSGGHWDPAPHNVTTWRPDIFIGVQAKTLSGDWAHLGKSKVYGDQKLANDRKIDLRVAIEPVEKKMTAFDPGTHGFKFNNKFSIDPSVFGVQLGSWDLGLCGGMSAGALQRFNSGQPIPPVQSPPKQNTQLYDELLDRQIRSLPPHVIQRIYDWQSAPDEGHWNRKHSVGYRTKQEWPGLRAELHAGRPTQLVLIRVEGYAANMSENHQVLAIGYEWNPTTKDLVVFTCDPNDHGHVNQLRMNLGLSNSKLHAKDSTGKRLRGFFVNPAGASAAS